ncbi:MAG: PAS domain S-box protein, partial [Bacteroidia bacterium]
MKHNFLILSWIAYKNYVRDVVISNSDNNANDISHWRNEIFCNTLTFLAPLSIVALIPGITMAFLNGLPVVGIADILAFAFIILIIVNRRISLRRRKIIFICALYGLSIILLYYLAMPGPGLLFSLTATIFSSVIYSSSAARFSAWTNAFICTCFGLLLYFRIKIPMGAGYDLGTWIAVSSNLVFLSFVCYRCLNLLINGLETSLDDSKTLVANLTSITENTDAMIYSLDRDFRYITFNQRLKNSVKQAYNIDIKPGDTAFDFLEKSSPDEALFWKNIYTEALKGKAIHFEKDFSFGGHTTTTAFSFNAIIENSKVTGLSCFAADITERKLAEQRQIDISNNLNRTVNDLQNIMDSSLDIICSMNEEGEFVNVSKAAENILGYHPSELLGKKYIDMVLDDDVKKTKRMAVEIMSGRPVTFFENRCVHKNGSIVQILWSATWDKDFKLMYCIAKDVTERKKTEEEKEKMSSDLIQRSKNLEQFTYIVSHNLRAPVANIMGFAELLKYENSNPGLIVESVKGMSAAAYKLDEVIKDLNEILQIRTLVSENKEEVYFQNLVDDIALSIDNIIKKENVIIRTDFESVGKMLSVKSYLHSVFYNLIINSIKFHKPGVHPL